MYVYGALYYYYYRFKKDVRIINNTSKRVILIVIHNISSENIHIIESKPLKGSARAAVALEFSGRSTTKEGGKHTQITESVSSILKI